MLSQEQRICEHSKENEPAMSDFFHEYLPGDPRERIKDLLLERKITQAQLAETIGISESTLNRCLSGQTEQRSVESHCGHRPLLQGQHGLPAGPDGYPLRHQL